LKGTVYPSTRSDLQIRIWHCASCNMSWQNQTCM